MSAHDEAQFHLDLLRAYLDSTSDAIFVLCDEMRFLVCNAVAEDWFGRSEGELTCHNDRIPVTELFGSDEAARRFKEHFATALTENTADLFECHLRPPGASPRWVEFSANRVRIEDGLMIVVVGRDVTAQRLARTQMQKLSRAVEQTADTVMITDLQGVTEYTNPAFEAVTGYSRAEVLGKPSNLFESPDHDDEFCGELRDTVLSGESFCRLFVNRKKNGSVYYDEKTISPLTDDHGNITHFIATGKDVTGQIRDRRKIDYLVNHDALTGLPNRSLVQDRLDHAVAAARREGWRVVFLILDLDRFKTVNESLGHGVGDALIKEAAKRLRSGVREVDTVGRIGSDEFAVILEGISDVVDIERTAAGIIDAFSLPFRVGGQEVVSTVSVGITVYPDDSTDWRALLSNAEAAMANAKEAGGAGYRFFTAELTDRIRRRLALEQELRQALEREEFVLHYQPVIDLQTGEVAQVEALVRWQHPQRGLVGPLEFIPLMEETGLIKVLGAWILRSVGIQGSAWRARYPRVPRISVNVSGCQFSEREFVDSVLGNLGASGLHPGGIELEITESVFMDNLDTIHGTLETLSELGVTLALDDFGTGYSSLSYLKRFRVDTLKIDRSFVRDLPADGDDAAIVTAIMAMARSLRLRVIAEGVETQAQLDFLRQQGCRLVQGFLFSKPRPAAALDPLIEHGLAAVLEDVHGVSMRVGDGRRVPGAR